MDTFRVVALNTARMRMDLSGLVHSYPPGTEVVIPVFAVAAEGAGHRILIDTGISDPAWFTAAVGDETWQEKGETLPEGLSGLGWEPDEVDVVINTHLHADHCGGNALFANARFFVGASEWPFAHNPLPSQRTVYAEREFDAIPYLRWTLVPTDHFDVLPGLRIIQTPGHTPGHQCVLLNTAQGVLAVVGDAANVQENWTNNLPGAILWNTELAYASMEKIRRLADRVLMAHDRTVQHAQDSSFPSLG